MASIYTVADPEKACAPSHFLIHYLIATIMAAIKPQLQAFNQLSRYIQIIPYA